MPRPKKDAVAVNIRMDRTIAERLEVYCEDTGQTKTTAIERILASALEEYYSQPHGKRIPR